VLRYLSACANYLLFASVSFAHEVGDIVIVVRDSALTENGKVVGQVFAGIGLTIRAIDNELLQVQASKRGWLDCRSVISSKRRSLTSRSSSLLIPGMPLPNPWDASSYRGRGAARLIQKQYDLAIADCDTSIRLDPKNASVYATRAKAGPTKGITTGRLPTSIRPCRLIQIMERSTTVVAGRSPRITSSTRPSPPLVRPCDSSRRCHGLRLSRHSIGL